MDYELFKCLTFMYNKEIDQVDGYNIKTYRYIITNMSRNYNWHFYNNFQNEYTVILKVWIKITYTTSYKIH